MLKPRALRSGDRLAIVAPASHFERSEFDQGIAEILNLGFEPVYDHTVFAKKDFVAGPAALRAAAIRAAWNDPSIAGLVAVRGGYGSAQVLPLLDPAEARQARKHAGILSQQRRACALKRTHKHKPAGFGDRLDQRAPHAPARAGDDQPHVGHRSVLSIL